MTDTRKASLHLYASPKGDGLTDLRMECEFEGDFDPNSQIDKLINHFAEQLIEGSALLEQVQAKPEPSRILVPGGL